MTPQQEKAFINCKAIAIANNFKNLAILFQELADYPETHDLLSAFDDLIIFNGCLDCNESAELFEYFVKHRQS